MCFVPMASAAYMPPITCSTRDFVVLSTWMTGWRRYACIWMLTLIDLKKAALIEQLFVGLFFYFDGVCGATFLCIAHIVPQFFRHISRTGVVVQDHVSDTVFVVVVHV